MTAAHVQPNPLAGVVWTHLTSGTADETLWQLRRADAEVERLRQALHSIRHYSDGAHRQMGEACGEDLCLGCLINGTALAALDGSR